MVIVFSKDNAAPKFVPANLCLSFYRAFRAELWRSGIMRDPQAGDEILGVKIIVLSA